MIVAATPSTSNAVPVPSSHRPIPLQGRRDLTVSPMTFQGEQWWVVKDAVGLCYHRLQPHHYRTLTLLDGERSLKAIRDQLAVDFPTLQLQLADVQELVTHLHTVGLAWSQRPGQSAHLLGKQRDSRRQRRWRSIGSLLSIRLPGWDPDPTLRWIHPWLRWIYHPVTGVVALLLVISAWTLLLVQFDEFHSRLPEFRQFFSWRNMVWLWVTLGVTKILHEFGHGLTCHHFGGECHEMGVMLLVFSPTLYCDVTDSWMLRDKWQRIWIAAGGMVIETVLSAIAIFVWWFTNPGLLNHLCLNVFFVTTLTTVIFNANPLMRYDGYYMLSDWLGIPNLRDKASRQLRESFSEICLGVGSPPDARMPATRRIWFVTYSIAATVYGWFVLSSILLFLYMVLKPYGLQSIGKILVVASLCSIVGNLLFNVSKIVVASRSQSMSRIRITATTVVVLASITAAVSIPLPWYIEAPFVIEPHAAAHVLTSMPGQLTSFAVHAGDTVRRGQLLAVLRDDEKHDLWLQLTTARESQNAEIAMLLALDIPAEHAVAMKRLQAIDRQLVDLQEQLAALRICAPISGVVIEAPLIPAPPNVSPRRLQMWSGHIGHPGNIGCVVPTRTHLLSIAPDDRMQAVLYLDQAHRDDLAVTQQIQIKFGHLAEHTYLAQVTEIAHEHSDRAPAGLTTRQGGGLASVADLEGRERLTSAAYQARVLLDQETQFLKPGMRGTARFLVERRSAAQWIWRALRRTIHFRI